MAGHDPSTGAMFLKAMRGCEKFSEIELLDAMRPTILKIEKDDTYTTDEKLKIFSALTTLSNCAEHERLRFAQKAAAYMK